MECHIVPIAYISSWATYETIALKRDKRKSYVIRKNDANSEEKLIKLVCVKDETILKTDLYIGEENDAFVEDEMNHLFENGWKKYIVDLDDKIANRVNDKILVDEYLLRFFTLQIYRTDEYMKPIIKDVVKVINEVIPSAFNPILKDLENKTFLRFIGEFLRGDEGVVNETLNDVKKNYSKRFLVKKGSSDFITGDLPAYNIVNEEITKGLYFILSPQICLFLCEEKNNECEKAKVISVGDNIIKFINYLTYSRAKNSVFASTPNMRNMISDLYSEKEFKKIFKD